MVITHADSSPLQIESLTEEQQAIPTKSSAIKLKSSNQAIKQTMQAAHRYCIGHQQPLETHEIEDNGHNLKGTGEGEDVEVGVEIPEGLRPDSQRGGIGQQAYTQ